MPAADPVSPRISARIIYGALVLVVVLFWAGAWYIGAKSSTQASEIPDQRVLYVGLVIVSAVLFGAGSYTAGRLIRPRPGTSKDEWWRANLVRVIRIWALVEAPAILGTVAYILTHDFRTLLLAPFTVMLLFVNYRPSRLAGR